MTCSRCEQRRYASIGPEEKKVMFDTYHRKVSTMWIAFGLIHNPFCFNCYEKSTKCINIHPKFQLDTKNRIVLCDSCHDLYINGNNLPMTYSSDSSFIEKFLDIVKDKDFNGYTYDELLACEKAIRRNKSIVYKENGE